MTYECVICHAVNAASRIHCKACGTIPACYSWTGKPARYIQAEALISDTVRQATSTHLDVVIAWGALRSDQCRTARVNLRRVADDYYAWE